MRFPRAAGLLLHPTSLPGPNGIGELGADAVRFLDFLSAAGIRLWQMLPLGPTGYGDSPYQCFSAFAGNPLLIAAPSDGTVVPAHRVDFARVVACKRGLLARAIADFVPNDAYHAFVSSQQHWLPDYALFTALKEAHGGAAWPHWEPGAARRDPEALVAYRQRYAADVSRVQVEQYLFASQFDALRLASAERGIRLMGDLPIYVAHDSADVWAHRELFRLRDDGLPEVQAGVPPDYFSPTGQLWGNPIYDWDAMRRTGFAWWIERMRHALSQFDLLRLDHFRGFEAYWEVPAEQRTAERGHWVEGPGAALFDAIGTALGPLPIIAEDLGVITAEVKALRKKCGFPGMHVLQFSFGVDENSAAMRPNRFSRSSVVYTGTHDNDTTVGWWQSTDAADSTRSVETVETERAVVREYFSTDGSEIHWTMIQAALDSVCDTAIIPMQDVLGLGSDARMNRPGRPADNWRWRFTWNEVTPAVTSRLRALVERGRR